MFRTILFALIGVFLLPSCKEEGCTDLDAINFSIQVDRDDGSCEYLYHKFTRVWLDSTHAFSEDSLYAPQAHKYIVRFTPDLPLASDTIHLTSGGFREWRYTYDVDIVIPNMELTIDLYYDEMSNHVATYKGNIFDLITNPSIPGLNPTGAHFGDAGLHFEVITKQG